ncbi:MAG: four helix bundle protein, partial [Lutibacter sp.]|nr:four helix bundle protein [Lutibacter sp.]
MIKLDIITNDISDILVEFLKYEVYTLSPQLIRCSISIPSNITKGLSRTNK